MYHTRTQTVHTHSHSLAHSSSSSIQTTSKYFRNFPSREWLCLCVCARIVSLLSLKNNNTVREFQDRTIVIIIISSECAERWLRATNIHTLSTLIHTLALALAHADTNTSSGWRARATHTNTLTQTHAYTMTRTHNAANTETWMKRNEWASQRKEEKKTWTKCRMNWCQAHFVLLS